MIFDKCIDEHNFCPFHINNQVIMNEWMKKFIFVYSVNENLYDRLYLLYGSALLPPEEK